MPRQLRIQYPGAVYHILARGDRREAIVEDDGDREMFVATLAEACKRTGWQVLAWVLMDNHYHWLVRTPEPNLVDGMKWFQLTYTQRYNARHRGWGHLFGGRYKAIPVQAEGEGAGDYLKTLMDYIHLNPVRARMVKAGSGLGLLDYRWSSLAQGYGLPLGKKRPKWLEVEEGLKLWELADTAAGRRIFIERLEKRSEAASRKKCGLPQEDLCEGAQMTVRRGWYWGTQAFREWLEAKVGGAGRAKPKGRSLAASAESRASHDQAEAERLVISGMKDLGLSVEDLDRLAGSDPRKVAMAQATHSVTSVSQVWMAERLKMKSAANVSQQLRRLKRGELKLNREAKAWLARAVS
jgi:REP element-mobilizing transposase RayT